MKYLLLAAAAYVLIVAESTLLPVAGTRSCGAFVWLLLPWIATLEGPRVTVVSAAIYGLLVDCCSGAVPGLFMSLTILAVAGLHLTLPSWVTTFSIPAAATSGLCALFGAVGTAAVLSLLDPSAGSIDQALTDATVPALVGSAAVCIGFWASNRLAPAGSKRRRLMSAL